MIKVLNIVTTPICTDGISNCIVNYLENINDKEIKLDFACPRITEEYKKRIKAKSSKIHIIKSNRKHFIKYIQELKKIIKNNNYDIVHIHGSSAILSIELLAAKIGGCKHRIIHSHNTKSDHPILHKLLTPIFNILCTDRLACGEAAGKWLFKNKIFKIIPNGNDINKFKYNEKIRNKIRKKYNIDNKIVIGHVGSFNYQKNHEFIINMFEKLYKNNNNYYLVLIGAGGTKERIEKLAEEKGINNQIIFTGAIDNVNEWLQAMDLMILPSRFEGFPMVLIEWQIAGLPTIVSSNVTKKTNITGLLKFLSIDGAPDAWIKEIKNINIIDRKDNKDLLETIKKEGFDIKENTKELEKVYKKICRKINL